MSNSSSQSPGLKAQRGEYRKPSDDFPLSIHPTGRWVKKVKGRTVYFGRIDADPLGKKALKLWQDNEDDLKAGRIDCVQLGKPGRPVKRKKPRADFPLFHHASGRWAKKVKSKTHYFGKVVDDPKGDKAQKLWAEQKDDLLAGRVPRTKDNRITIGRLCNDFLTAKKALADAGEITPRTYSDYESTTERIAEQFGERRPADDLQADDFGALRKSISAKWGPVALGNEINRVRVVFKYGYDAGLLDRPMRFGPMFKRPSRKTLLVERHKKGQRMFEAAEIVTMLNNAGVPLKAMILLGINCGFGNGDIGRLPLSAIDLDGGWIRFPRPKTGIDRRCKLWPETIVALKAAINKRPTPKNPRDKGLAFITKRGESWFKDTRDNPITKEARKLLDESKLYRPGLGFYALRHTFETIGGETADQVAVNSIMGHVDSSMAGVYRERISEERLTRVSDFVRAWVYDK